MNAVESFIVTHWNELFAATSGLIYIFLSVRRNIWLWPVGIVSSALYAGVYFQATLYADMGLQVYYLIVSLYGWYFWIKGNKKNTQASMVKISVLKPRQWAISTISALLLGLILYLPMAQWTNASNPLWDGMLTSGSIVATWMLARKILDQWLFWIVIDGASIALCLVKGLYLTAFLNLVYTAMAIQGYIKWKVDYKLQQLQSL